MLAKWTKKEGDKIAPGDVIAEVETDKANMEFPLEDEGVLLKLLVNEGDTVKLGDPVAILGEAGEDPAQAMSEIAASAGAKPAADKKPGAEDKKSAAKPAEDKKSAAKKPAATEDEAAAAPAEADDASESDDADADADEGDDADESEGADADDAGEKKTAAASAKKTAAPAKKTAAPSATAATENKKAAPAKKEEAAAGNGHGRVLASPFARKLALEKGVDLRALNGSGPHGRIVARDIETAAAQPKPQLRSVPAATQAPRKEDELVPASQMRKTIARRLVEAKREIPHIYLTADATVDRLVEMREQLNESSDVKISINDLVIKALAVALRRIPEANVSWTAEGILHHGAVHVGMAVSLPDGLITPVIRDADVKSIGALASETKSLAERARAKKLQPPEYTGASATVSNLGMYGVREFVAIINPPESVILAVGATEKRAVVVDKNGHDELEIARRMTLTLSCDHRVVDGVLGARLLAEIVKLLGRPMGMLL